MIPLARLEPGTARFDADVEFDVLDAAAEEQGFEVHVSCDVDNRGARIHVRGDVRGTAHSQCHRCLEPFDRKVKGVFETMLDRSGKDLGDEVIEVAEDLEEYDLVPFAREAMIVEEPLQLRCQPDCRGLCVQCGANLNDGTCSCTQPADPRWDALKELGRKLDSGSGS